MSGHYEIHKNTKTEQWEIAHVGPGWITPLGKFPKRKQALMTARLLAGRRGVVKVGEARA